MDMPARPVFEGIWLPMVTPMRAGHVDCEAAQALARYYRNAGIAGWSCSAPPAKATC